MITTGIGQEEKVPSNDLFISIYPNPVSDVLFVSNESAKNMTVKLSVMNALGQIMEEHSSVELNSLGQYELNCSGWGKGIYYVSVADHDAMKVVRLVKL